MLAGVGSIFNKNGLPPRREEWQWAMRSVPSLWLRAPLPAAHRHHRVRKFQQRIVENTQREVLPTTMRDGRDPRSAPQTTPHFKGDAFSLRYSNHLTIVTSSAKIKLIFFTYLLHFLVYYL